MNSSAKPPTGSNFYSKWVLISLVLVCIAAFAVVAFVFPGDVTDPGFIMGQQLVFALLIWTLFRVFIQRNELNKHGGKTFFTIYLTMVVAGVLGSNIKEERLKSELKLAKPSIKQAMDSAIAGVGSSRLSSINTSPKANGDVGEMEHWLKESMKSLVDLGAEYQQELKGLGRDQLSGVAGVDQPGILEHREVIAEHLMSASLRFKSTYLARVDSVRNSILALNVGDDMKRGILEGFDKGYNRHNLEQTLDLDYQAFQQIQHQCQILIQTRGHWSLVGGELHFQRNQDMEEFNKAYRAIQSISAKETAILEDSKKQMRESEKNLDALGK